MASRDSREGPAVGSSAGQIGNGGNPVAGSGQGAGTGTETGAGNYVVQGKLSNFKPGDIIGGSYEIIEQLGRGAMGMVFKAKHVSMGTEYALKVLSAEQLTDIALRRFQNEAQATAKLNHPNVIAIYNFGLHGGQLPFYVMDFLQGENLLDKVMEYGPMPINHAMQTFIEVCAGLGYAHRKGILHRDVKPANIVILDTPDVHGARVKVVDFGIVKFAEEIKPDAQKLTAMGDVCGSPTYMSPEQASGEKVDPRSDIYSLGCALYECLTGTLPFRGRNPMETMMMHHSTPPPTLQSNGGGRKFPEDLEILVAKMLAKAPMDRYQSMDAVAMDMKNILEGQPLGTPQVLNTNKSQPSGRDTIRDTNRTTSQSTDVGISTSTRIPLRPASPGEEITRRFNSRSTLARGTADDQQNAQSTGEDYDYDEPQSKLDNLKLFLIPLIAVGLLGAVAYFTWNALKPKEIINTGNQQVQSTRLKDKEDGAINSIVSLSKGYLAEPEHVEMPKVQYFSRRIKKQGKEYIEFNFPDFSGQENALAWISTPELRATPCSGQIQVPSGAKIAISPSGFAEANPEFFKKFRPGEIYEITIFPPYGSDKAFIACSEIQQPGRLRLSNCNELSAAIFPQLKKMSSLQELEVTGGTLAPSFFAQIPYIENLKLIGFFHMKHISPLIERIGSSKSLETLYLQHCDPTDADYQTIANIPNLKTLSLCGNKVNQEQLRLLARARRLTRLDIAETRLHSDIGPILRTFPSLHSIILSKENMGSRHYKEALLQWHKELPQFDIKIK